MGNEDEEDDDRIGHPDIENIFPPAYDLDEEEVPTDVI